LLLTDEQSIRNYLMGDLPMGWFNNTTTEESKLTKEEAYAGILLGAIASDGEIVEEEVMGLVGNMLRMQMFAGWSDREFNRTFRRLGAELKKTGMDTFTSRLVEALPGDMRQTAFVNACDLVMADGKVLKEEERFIDHLVRHLSIEPDFARQTIEILTVKNRG
jgi:uncharacterized tellurite resistance protein B-like protein